MLTVPVTNIAQPQNVTAFEIVQVVLTADAAKNTLASAQIIYVAGNMSAAPVPVFLQIGGTQTIALDEDQCSQLLATQPALYSGVKALLYPAIEQSHGVTGVVS